ncbi:hypothetical protein GMRT_12998 [Giardia muris]|uniref:Uncharacterized protein n=1 Tax=Giardia muris TaxID=5742 RepID=A0A4Z1SZY7_GIAMU|nr:hypothetical protein GMRT_12998 [Giardia muris]|eukprot:TNJ30305.1 hypothetical protein GMRT_12998 [Giardia muris]
MAQIRGLGNCGISLLTDQRVQLFHDVGYGSSLLTPTELEEIENMRLQTHATKIRALEHAQKLQRQATRPHDSVLSSRLCSCTHYFSSDENRIFESAVQSAGSLRQVSRSVGVRSSTTPTHTPTRRLNMSASLTIISYPPTPSSSVSTKRSAY